MKEEINKNFEDLYKNINKEEKAISNLLLLSMDTKDPNTSHQHSQIMTIIKGKLEEYHLEGYINGSYNTLTSLKIGE